MPGLVFGPEPLPLNTRINRRAPNQHPKKKSRRDRARLARLAKKKVVKEERLRREMVLRDWLREWPCDGLPAVPALKKPKRDPTAHHCAEQVTAEVRRVLGRSSKAKIKKTKDSQKERQEKRDEAEKMRIRHKEQESLGTKWKPGSRNTTHEDRSGKAKKRKAMHEKEKKAKQEKLKTAQASKDQEESTVSSDNNPAVSQAEAKQTVSEETNPGGEEHVRDVLKLSVSSDEENVNIGTDQPTFSELTNLTFSPDIHHQLEAEINFKQMWRDQPDLTDDSGDEEDLKRTIKMVSSGGGQKCDKDVANLTDSSDEDDVGSDDEEEVSLGRGQECNGEMPDLTDSSDGEDVNNGTDQQDKSRPTFSEFIQREVYLSRGLLTASSCEKKDLASAKTKAFVRRGRRMLAAPELTDDSDDEQERPPTFSELYNTTRFSSKHPASRSRPKAFGDLGGGGNLSQETSQSLLAVSAMLATLKLAIGRTGLPLKLDRRTPAEGNCFSHSVVQQCQRAVVREELRRQGKTVTTYMALKRDVRQFILDRQDHPRIKEMKLNYEQKQGQLAQEGQPTRGWLIYWEDMLKNGEWADDTFVQATAFFLNLDFFLVIADSATYTQLFHPISGDIDSDRVGSPGRPTLLIGYISDQHYQSLLLAEEEPSVSGCPTSQAVDEALRRAFSALQLELLKQSRQVSWIFKMVLSNWKLISLLCE